MFCLLSGLFSPCTYSPHPSVQRACPLTPVITGVLAPQQCLQTCASGKVWRMLGNNAQAHRKHWGDRTGRVCSFFFFLSWSWATTNTTICGKEESTCSITLLKSQVFVIISVAEVAKKDTSLKSGCPYQHFWSVQSNCMKPWRQMQ